MSTITEQVRKDLTDAMKARDALRVGALRMLSAGLKNEQIERGHELSDEEAIAVIRRQAKQRQDSIELYRKGNREELADKESAELVILEAYLPRQLSDADVERIIAETIAAVGAESKKDAGRVIKDVMGRYKGVIDGRKVQEIVQRMLP